VSSSPIGVLIGRGAGLGSGERLAHRGPGLVAEALEEDPLRRDAQAKQRLLDQVHERCGPAEEEEGPLAGPGREAATSSAVR
jgi:hypothetical protein